MYSQTLTAAGYGNEFIVKPGQSLDYTATTADLDQATLSLEQSDNGSVWVPARDATGALVPDLVGAGDQEDVAVVLAHDQRHNVRYRAVLVETGTLAGTVDTAAAERNDPATAEDAFTFGDTETVAKLPIVLPALVDATLLPDYADNAAALTASAPAGSLYVVTATGALARVIAA